MSQLRQAERAVAAQYARTHARLADDPEYQRLKEAAEGEATDAPNRYLHRNTFAFYIEVQTPMTRIEEEQG